MGKDEDVISLSLTGAMNILVAKGWTKKQIGNKIGVTELQVHYYHTGKTKTPSPKVCKNIFDNIKIEGKKVLVSLYSSVKELEDHYEVYKDRTND